jgi:adhesin HecA-like repeat protein
MDKCKIGVIAVLLGMGLTAQATSWNVQDGKWETASNWDNSTVPTGEAGSIANGGTARIDGASGAQTVGPGSGGSGSVANNSTLNISGGSLSANTGYVISNTGTLDMSGGQLTTANAFTINAGQVNLSGGTITVGNDANDIFVLKDGGILNYTGGQLNLTGDWNRNQTSQSAATLRHNGLVGSGNFNAIDIADQLYASKLTLDIDLAGGASFNAKEAFILFEFRSGQWKGIGDEKFFTQAGGGLIQDFDNTAFGEASEDSKIITIDGNDFYLDYNFNVAGNSEYTVINDSNYDGTSTERQVALIAIPEPATIGLISAFGAGMMMIRRLFLV